MNSGQRHAEIAGNLRAVEERIATACRAAGRRRDEITLVAVTKTFPVSDVRHLVELGVHDVAENRDQEARPKSAECARIGLADLRWHFVGQLQTNKTRSVSTYAHLVHSVDRPRLVSALDRAAASARRRLTCLVQVDLEESPDAGDAARGGARPADVGPLAAEIAEAQHLELGGVMAVAPLGQDPAGAFAMLRSISDRLRSSYPDAAVVSAGMSGDLEAAVSGGATHLRVGTALLGSRPPLR